MPTLKTVALPKSTAGRRAKPIDEAFVTAVVKEMQKHGGNVDKSGNRPFHVNDDPYDTKGKAAAEGRRYANAVASAGGFPKVSVRVYPDGKEFKWGLYLPIPGKNGGEAEDTE